MDEKAFDKMMEGWLERQAEKEPSGWSEDARKWAEKNGIIAGDEQGNKQYRKPCTREELVQVLYKLFKMLK